MLELPQQSRRGFVAGLGTFFAAAPAIVRATSIMPVRACERPPIYTLADYTHDLDSTAVAHYRGGNLLTIQQITREAIKLFQNSNEFIKQLNAQYAREAAFYEGQQWPVEYSKPNPRIGAALRIRLPNNAH